MASGITGEHFDSRLALAKDLDADFHSQYDLERVRAYSAMYDDAVRIMNSEDLEVFNLPRRRRKRGRAMATRPSARAASSPVVSSSATCAPWR